MEMNENLKTILETISKAEGEFKNVSAAIGNLHAITARLEEYRYLMNTLQNEKYAIAREEHKYLVQSYKKDGSVIQMYWSDLDIIEDKYKTSYENIKAIVYECHWTVNCFTTPYRLTPIKEFNY